MKVLNTEQTPNPNALKFNLDENFSKGTSKSFNSREEAENNSLAKMLFALEGVEAVFYLDSFVSVSKTPVVHWEKLIEQVKGVLENFDFQKLAETDEIKASAGESETEESNELFRKINELIDRDVRPALANDGGGLEIVSLDGFQVQVRYQGACGSCPSSIQGTLAAIENLVKLNVDDRIKLVAV